VADEGEECDRDRSCSVECEVVAFVGADLDRVETQHAGAVDRRVGRAGAVAVVGQDDELEARPRHRFGDRVGPAQAVGPVGVNVYRPRDGAVVERYFEGAARRGSAVHGET
jgi:hypothetical protein